MEGVWLFSVRPRPSNSGVPDGRESEDAIARPNTCTST